MAYKKFEIRSADDNYTDVLVPKTTMEQVIDPDTGLNMYVTLGMHTLDSTIHFTPAERTKLSGIATGANNYTHPTTAGNKHIPAGGTQGQYLVNTGLAGTATWQNPPTIITPSYRTIYDTSTTSVNTSMNVSLSTNGKTHYRIICMLVQDQAVPFLELRVNGYGGQTYRSAVFQPSNVDIQDSGGHSGYYDRSEDFEFVFGRGGTNTHGVGTAHTFTLDVFAHSVGVNVTGMGMSGMYMSHYSGVCENTAVRNAISSMVIKSDRTVDGYSLKVLEMI